MFSVEAPWPWEFDTVPYREATTRKELCSVKKFYYAGDKKSLRGFSDRCEKSKSDHLFFCPKKDLPGKAKDKSIAIKLNKNLAKYFVKKSKKKKKNIRKTKKKKKKRMKKKRKRRRGKNNKKRDKRKNKRKNISKKSKMIEHI